jgi:putative oxidoreductase
MTKQIVSNLMILTFRSLKVIEEQKESKAMVHSPDKNQVMLFVGRVLVAMIFIASGLSKIPGWESTISYMASRGIPWVPLFLFPAIFIEVLGGLSILLGFRAKAGAIVLLLYLIPVTLLFHGFWSEAGAERQMQLINFMKNLAIMGGLFGLAANGAGVMSVDYKLSRRKFSTPASKDRIRAVS